MNDVRSTRPQSRAFSRAGRKTVALGSGLLLAALGLGLSAPAQARPTATSAASVVAANCPTAVPLSAVTAGLKGEGLTTVSGNTPQAFGAEVLGILKDGIGAGRDLIMVKIYDLPGQHVVDQGDGIWSGMSGSPIYVDGQLLGSASYGFTLAPSLIIGVTPGAYMLDLLNGTQTTTQKAARPNQKVALSSGTKRALAAKAGVAAPRGTLQQLATPLGVSGLGPKRVAQVQKEADAAGMNVQAYATGSASAKAGAAPTARPEAGGNFGALLTYGDVTLGGLGTTTAVCNDRAIAFGHPLDQAGPSSYLATDGQTIAIVKDATFGPFKLANFGDPLGTVDQDRLLGVTADLTRTPQASDVTTTISNADSGRTRTGTTKVVDQTVLPAAVFYTALSNYDNVFDEQGDGTATSSWTISGTRAGGKAFSVTRANRWAARSYITEDPAFDAAIAADTLINNDAEEVKVDQVSYSSSVSTKFEQLHITKTEVSVNGGKYSSPKSLSLKVGAKLKVRVTLKPYRGTTTSTEVLSLTVPKSARGQSGSLDVAGGLSLVSDSDEEETDGCLLSDDTCDDEAEPSLDAIIKGLVSAPRNDDLVAEINLESDDDSSKSVEPVVSTTVQQKLTVTGARSIGVNVRR